MGGSPQRRGWLGWLPTVAWAAWVVPLLLNLRVASGMLAHACDRLISFACARLVDFSAVRIAGECWVLWRNPGCLGLVDENNLPCTARSASVQAHTRATTGVNHWVASESSGIISRVSVEPPAALPRPHALRPASTTLWPQLGQPTILARFHFAV